MPLTPPPAAPSPGQDAATFNANVEARLAWDAVNVAELNALQADVTEKQETATTNALQTAEDRTATESAALAAAAIAGATKWVSGTYAEGACAWSIIDSQTYRRKAPGGASPTDPALDSINWEILGGVTSVNGQKGALTGIATTAQLTTLAQLHALASSF